MIECVIVCGCVGLGVAVCGCVLVWLRVQARCVAVFVAAVRKVITDERQYYTDVLKFSRENLMVSGGFGVRLLWPSKNPIGSDYFHVLSRVDGKNAVPP